MNIEKIRSKAKGVDGIAEAKGATMSAREKAMTEKPAGLSTKGPLRVDVLASGETRWAANSLRFQTPEEAKSYASDLYGRWMLMDKFRVVPSDHPQGEAYVAGSEDSW